MLVVITPSTASAIQALDKSDTLRVSYDDVRFFVTPVGSLTISLIDDAIKSARPSQVVMDADTLAPDLRADCAANLKGAVWMDSSEPPQGWEEQIRAELAR